MTKNVEIHNGSGTIGFLGLLTALFFALKLTGVIDWSWFWVLSPLLIPIIIGVFIIIVVLIIVVSREVQREIEFKRLNRR